MKTENKLELWAKADSHGSNEVCAFYEDEPPNDVKTSPASVLAGFNSPDFVPDDGLWHKIVPGEILNGSGGKRYWLAVEGTCGEYTMAVTLMPDGEYKVFSGQVRKTMLMLLQDQQDYWFSELPDLVEELEEDEDFEFSFFVDEIRESMNELHNLYTSCFSDFVNVEDKQLISSRFSALAI